jgi:hypothetical protein
LAAAVVGLVATLIVPPTALGEAPLPERTVVTKQLLWEGRLAKPGERPIRPLKASRLALKPFESAPFPYDGLNPSTGKPFLDVDLNGRRGRHSPRTNAVHWADETYADNRVLLYLPKGFRAAAPAVMVVFLHGNGATLERDVIERQKVVRQLALTGLNSVLVAPQLAADAFDSSAGKLWQPGAFRRLLEEAAAELGRLHGNALAEAIFQAMPVVLVAYSGGYLPAAYALHHGGADDRIAGVAILDGLYSDHDKFTAWIERRGHAFFFSAWTKSSAEGNRELARLLAERGIEAEGALGRALAPGSVTLLDVPGDVSHSDFVTRAWTEFPVRDLLSRLPGISRRARSEAKR